VRNGVLGCVRKSIASWSRVLVIPLSPGEAMSEVLCPVLCSLIQERRGHTALRSHEEN